jgi:16S rRNA (guanine(1405)-N(7))-methyltransferase
MTDINALVSEIANSKKYRPIGLSEDTIRDILLSELANYKDPKEAVQAAKKKLHEVVALYLGDPNYERARHDLETAFASRDRETVLGVCIDILRIHDSTRERLLLLPDFYEQIFKVTGTPSVLMDVASALNPLTLPWMNLAKGARYYAYEIHQPRVDLLNTFFDLHDAAYDVGGRAFLRDILVHPPDETGDVALLLKEIHRMEKRRRGISLPLLDALKVRWLVISLPARSLSGHGMAETNRQQIHGILADRPWPITEIAFDNEIVYCIEKS